MPSASPSPSSTPSTSSGIATSTSGDRHIPASIRADGSIRKEIKIRPGYKPPEDVEVYKNRTAEAFKARGSSRVPGAPTADAQLDDKTLNSKNAKRREARKRAKAADEHAQDSAEDAVTQPGSEPLGTHGTEFKLGALSEKDAKSQESQPVDSTQQPDPEAEKVKQARNLKKKLRQARELREKKDKGQNLLPEQFEKVIKINELIRQLDNLGFDADGNSK